MLFLKKSVCSTCIKSLVSYVEAMVPTAEGLKSTTSSDASAILRSIHPACAAVAIKKWFTTVPNIDSYSDTRLSSFEQGLASVTLPHLKMTGSSSGSITKSLSATSLAETKKWYLMKESHRIGSPIIYSDGTA